MICTGSQIAAARALLRWSQHDLAKITGLNRNSVAYWEGQDKFATQGFKIPHAVRRIEHALTVAGVKTVMKPWPGVYLVLTKRLKANSSTRSNTKAVRESLGSS